MWKPRVNSREASTKFNAPRLIVINGESRKRNRLAQISYVIRQQYTSHVSSPFGSLLITITMVTLELHPKAPPSSFSSIDGDHIAIQGATNDEEAQQQRQQDHTSTVTDYGPPPDGGREAWLVVVGGFCTVFASFGWINCTYEFKAVKQPETLLRTNIDRCGGRYRHIPRLLPA